MALMTKEFVEVVFEGLDGTVALNLAEMISVGTPRLPVPEEGVWETAVDNQIIKDGISIKNVHVRILCYDESVYDVEMNFILNDTNAGTQDALQFSLHGFALELAEKCGVQSYYGGLEPAADQETRIFTNEKAGPLFLRGET